MEVLALCFVSGLITTAFWIICLLQHTQNDLSLTEKPIIINVLCGKLEWKWGHWSEMTEQAKPWGQALRLDRSETRDQTYNSANSITPKTLQMVTIYSPYCPIFSHCYITNLPSLNHSHYMNKQFRVGSGGFRDTPGQSGTKTDLFYGD